MLHTALVVQANDNSIKEGMEGEVNSENEATNHSVAASSISSKEM